MSIERKITIKKKSLFHKIIGRVCKSSLRHPAIWLIASLIVCIPAVFEVQKIGLDTDLIRLLPTHSPAASWTRKLVNVIDDGSYFSILFEGENRDHLLRAVAETAEEVRAVQGIRSIESQNPIDFYNHYRYLLIPDYYLEKILDYLIGLEAEVNPFTTDLVSAKDDDSPAARRERRDLEDLLAQYSHLSAYHQSADGMIMGMLIQPSRGFTDIHSTVRMQGQLTLIGNKISRKYNIWVGVGGSQVSNLREYDVILSDLRRSGLIATIAILFILILSFRSFRILPALIYPLGVGLLWAFALVPTVIGDLTTITSFLLLVLFGMGIDYSIHLVKRFQQELVTRPLEEALLETFLSTGKAVFISGLTTALPLFILAISDFKGFSEFGIIGGGAILVLLAVMLALMPAVLVMAYRLKMIKAFKPRALRRFMPAKWLSFLLGILILASIVPVLFWLEFDYDFTNLKARVPESENYRKRHVQVYTRSISPAAIYIASDLAALDKLVRTFKERMNSADSTIQYVSCIRNFSPDEAEMEKRLALIAEIKEQVQGPWIKRIKNPDLLKWIEDIREWSPPEETPGFQDIPESIRKRLFAIDGSDRFLFGVYPNISRRNGLEAMAFTKELYDLEIPSEVLGPVGEMPVFSEILWLVTREGPWVVLFTFIGVVLLVFLNSRSFKDTIWTIFPLVGGIVLCLGIMAVVGLRLNFFNVVVIPALLGMGVDHGVHYYRRWKELRKDTASTQKELFGPLSACTVTTMMGYSGMVVANHPGLQSIGLLACLGLACIWLTSLVLFPAILEFYKPRSRKKV